MGIMIDVRAILGEGRDLEFLAPSIWKAPEEVGLFFGLGGKVE